MARTSWIAICVFLLTFSLASSSQTCEDYNRKLFSFLPEDPPNQINCVDEKGARQGWWIDYKKLYRPKAVSNEGDSGDYVSHYQFGQFKDNRRVGIWKTVMNVHQVYEQRTDAYYYAKDTILISSGYYEGGWREAITYFNADSSVINYRLVYDPGSKEIEINCDRRKNKFDSSCKMTYRKQLIATFPHDRFELEKEKAGFMYEKEKKRIDEKLNGR